jgi:hypothetical protein
MSLLYRQLPQRKKPIRQQQSKVLKETEQPEDAGMGHTVSVSAGDGPSTILSSPKRGKSPPVRLSAGPNLSSVSKKSKDRRQRGRPFNLEKEKPEILQTIASASVASTNLINALKLVNRENQRVSEDPDVVARFELCKTLRRQILRYIQHIESDDFLGSLIHANEELVNALIAFETLDKSVDDDSDSENGSGTEQDVNENLAGLSLGTKPPRPPKPTGLSFSHSTAFRGKGRVPESESDEPESEEEDDDNPFGDKNAVHTPGLEKPGLTWLVLPLSLIMSVEGGSTNIAIQEGGLRPDFE